MSDKNVLLMSSSDLKELKQIGHGSDGAVYKYKDNLLIKLYHKNVQKIATLNQNDDDIKIYKKVIIYIALISPIKKERCENHISIL